MTVFPKSVKASNDPGSIIPQGVLTTATRQPGATGPCHVGKHDLEQRLYH